MILIFDALRARDPSISDMAQAFRMPPITCLRREVWPLLWRLVAMAA